MKKFLLKSLLVTVGLLSGGSAWGAPSSHLTNWTGLVGTVDNTSDLQYGSKKIRIAAGETYVYTLTNYNNGGSDTWKNWVIEGNSGEKYFDCCSNGDNWPYGTGAPTPSYSPVIATTDVADWMTKYNGAQVTITISRNVEGTEISVTHTSDILGTTDGNTDKYYGGTYTMAVGSEEAWDVYLTPRYSHAVITHVAYTNASGVVTNYELKNIDLSKFDTYFSGSYSEGVATFTNSGSSRVWAKLSLSSYFSGITGTITNVIMKFTENMDDGGRMVIGIYGNDKDSWPTNAYQDTGNSVSAWGLVGKNSATRIYYNNGTSEVYVSGGVNLNSTSEIVIDMDVVNKKFTWIQDGTTKVNNQYYCTSDVSLPQYLALYSWSPTNTTTLTDMTIEVAYVEATYYTATFTNTTSGNSVSATIYSDSERTIPVSNGLLENGETYYYTATETGYRDYNGSFTVSGSDPSVEFDMTAKTQFTYNVYAVNSSSEKLQEEPIATSTVYEDETATLTWSKYINIDGTWYSTSETTFRTTETEAGSRNVVYSASNVTYFYEMENLTRSGGAYLTEESTSYSNNSRLRLSRRSLYYTPALAAGVYTLSIPCANSNQNSNDVYVYTRSSGGDLSDVLHTHTATQGTTTLSATITVPEGYSIAFNGNEESDKNNNARMDYMTLTRTGVTATIGAKDYTTFASPYPLDCASLPDGLTAYYVEASKIDKTNSVVKLTKVTEAVAAGTGLLLKGTANQSYNIPVAASGTDLSSTNKMVGCTASTDITKSTANYANFYVMVNGETEPEFQNLKNYLDSHDKVTIPAGKAYLDATGVADVRSLKIAFEDAETGINEVNAPEAAANGYFNLAGQRVATPTKGLYIVNGKKVLVK